MTSQATALGAAHARGERTKRLTLLASILGSMLVFIDATVVNAALPALARDLDAGLAAQQWVVEAYMLTLASLILIGGSLGDLYGRRRVFWLGLASFGVTSLLCAISPTAEALVAARALQGVAGALLVPSTLALLTATFAESERGRAVGTWTAWTGIAGVIGPLGGGLLIDAASWRWIFLINLPIVVLTLAIIFVAVEESVDPDADPHPDIVGATLCTLGLAGPVFALIEQPRYGFGDARVLVPLLAGLACFGAFLVFERRARHPMLSLELFRSRNFTVANVACLSLYGGLAAAMFLIVIFVQQVAGYSALAAGLSLMPVTVVMFLTSRRFGALADRVGARVLMGAGPIVGGLGLLLLVRLDREVDYARVLLPAVLLFGLGLAMTVAPLTATVLGAVADRHAGVASGVNNAVARVAGLVAIAALGAVVSAQFSARLDERLDERLADVGRSPAAAAAIEQAKRRPLAGGRSAEGADLRVGTTRLGDAIDDAAVHAFRVGMTIAALLVIGGGVISAVGVRDARRPDRDLRPQPIAPGCHPQPYPQPLCENGRPRLLGPAPAEAAA